MKNATALPLLVATLAACGAMNDSTPQNLGSTDAPIAATSSGPFTTDFSTFFGHWIGTAEDPLALESSADGAPPAYHFPSGSSQIVLDFHPQSSNVGTLIFGAGEPPAEAPDAERGFPKGLDYEALLTYPGSYLIGGIHPFFPPTEGFEYGVWSTDERLDDGLLHFNYRTTDVLQDWCNLQQTFPDPNQPGYSCVEGDVTTYPDGTCHMLSRVPPEQSRCPEGVLSCDLPPLTLTDLGLVDCNKALLCENQYCGCIDEGCSVGFGPGFIRNLAEITLRRQGDDLVGVISNAAFLNERNALAPIGRLRLHRAD